jgi:predicted phosphodiesterase
MTKLKWDDATVEKVFDLFHRQGYIQAKIAHITGIPPRTVSTILNHAENIEEYAHMLVGFDQTANTDDDSLSNQELQEENVKLALRGQRLQDANRIERKGFREYARVDNTLVSLNAAILDILKKNKFTVAKKRQSTKPDGPVGILQLSDLHFNELIDDISGNRFDFRVASQRIHKYITKAKVYFKANGVSSVLVAFCGDLLNSDRRLSEITSAATNRSQAVFLAADILQQAILDLLDDFHVTVASVTGNESRVGEFVDWTKFLASDSYDIVIHNVLTYMFKGTKGINFIQVHDPLECVVEVNGIHVLMVHGHGHKGLARTANIEQGVVGLKARYAQQGVRVDYVLCGHIHSAFISDHYSRNSGLPGTNAYAERGLNLMGKASQNIHLAWKDGTLDSIKIDLQTFEDYEGYDFNEVLQAYHRDVNEGANVMIQSVLV